MNLVEKLRANAKDISRRFPIAGPSAADTLKQAADTIEAQSRLLAQAETLFGKSVELLMVKDYRDFGDQSADFDAMLPAAWESVRAAAEAFDLAQAEYQTTGTVPCGECEALRSQLDGPLECFDCGSAIQGYCPHCAPLERERLTVLMHEIRSKVRDKGLDIYERLTAIEELVREALAGKEPADV